MQLAYSILQTFKREQDQASGKNPSLKVDEALPGELNIRTNA